MTTLIDYLATEIQRHVTQVVNEISAERRLVFLGPPLEILEQVFTRLLANTANLEPDSVRSLPVLLQVPRDKIQSGNPLIGDSGWCDHAHLLTVRDTASCPRFLVLVPPGQHMDLSVSSTVEEFGVSARASAGMASFEEWWADPFIRRVIDSGLDALGFTNDREKSRSIVEAAASAADEIDQERSARKGAWFVVSRIFDAVAPLNDLTATTRLSAACGMPPMANGDLDPKEQSKALSLISAALEDGFKAGVDRALQNAVEDEVKEALEGFRTYIQVACDIPTVFERAPEAYYATSKGMFLNSPPSWWTLLTVEKWIELLGDSPPDGSSVILDVTNAISPKVFNGVFLVYEDVELRATVDDRIGNLAQAVLERRVGAGQSGRTHTTHQISGRGLYLNQVIPPHKVPVKFSLQLGNIQSASVKVLSLQTWDVGIYVQGRTVRKLSPTKKVTAVGIFETSLVLDGAGRHLIDVFVGPNITVNTVATHRWQEGASGPEEVATCSVRDAGLQHYNVEVETAGDSELEISFTREVSGEIRREKCCVHISCAEVISTGCPSEFERLVRENRSHRKVSVQVDRVARSSVLESWLLDESSAGQSWLPAILADDYAEAWSQPNWDGRYGPVFSLGRFINDPRPTTEEFRPPDAFIEARKAIISRIRGDDNSGLTAQAKLGHWIDSDSSFRELVEKLLDAYLAWFLADPDTACWSDVIAISTLEPGTRTLSSNLDAIILSPLHPVRLAWQCAAQSTLAAALDKGAPCPAAALLDPDSVPDILVLAIRGPDGIEYKSYVAVECNSDYWSVLWNGQSLSQISARGSRMPFGPELGVLVGGLTRGFSPSQVGKALDDVRDLLPAKPVLELGLSSSGNATDSCNEGIAEWCRKQFGDPTDGARSMFQTGPRRLEVYDARNELAQPDEAALANLVEDARGLLRWRMIGPKNRPVDLAIIAQLEASEPTLSSTSERSAISPGSLLRHRVRRQLGARQEFLVESRQATLPMASGDALLDKIAMAVCRLENSRDQRIGYRFAPDVHAIERALIDDQADFVAVSSAAVDPSCFVGDWLQGAYLWDYSLPSYSQRAGDTNGCYLISSIKEVDREALGKLVGQLPGCDKLSPDTLDELLREVARRGIPTVRELSGDDSKAAGALGMFIAARVLQDEFRVQAGVGSLIPVVQMMGAVPCISLVVPVDPFKSHIEELARASRLGKEANGRRPDLLVLSFRLDAKQVSVKLVPIEVKLRTTGSMSKEDSKAALNQAQALSQMLSAVNVLAKDLVIWRLAFHHLVLAMATFALRIYSQNRAIAPDGREWAGFQERFAASLLGDEAVVEIDARGRLLIIDTTDVSSPIDRDDDGFNETIVISMKDAARIVGGDPRQLYDGIRSTIGNWDLLPSSIVTAPTSGIPASVGEFKPIPGPIQDASATNLGEANVMAVPDMAVADGETGVDARLCDSQSKGIVLHLGTTVNRFEPEMLSLALSDTRLNQLNIGVVGDLGTGKTQLLKSLILQMTKASIENRGMKPRFLIFDYKKDYSSPDFVEAVGAKVVKPYQMPLNLFDTTGMTDSLVPWLDRFKFFADVLDKIFSNIGPVQRDKLKQAVRRAYESCDSQNRMPTLYDVHAEYKALMLGKSDAPLAIIDDLVDSEVFSRDPGGEASFSNFFDGVVVISLAALGQDDRSKNMIVAIMLNMFYEHMLNIPKRPFLGSDPQLRAIDSYLLVDEADNIMKYEFDVLRKLLLQGREFGVGIILASQYLRHFKVNATDYREPLLTWFIHKVPNVSASELGALGLSGDLTGLAEKVKVLPNHQCLFKSLGVASDVIKGLPFFEIVKR